MKQTAIEWLFEKMTEKGTNPYWDMRFEQAKEMEKQNIVDAYRFGIQDEYVIGSQQYYNKTFKQD